MFSCMRQEKICKQSDQLMVTTSLTNILRILYDVIFNNCLTLSSPMASHNYHFKTEFITTPIWCPQNNLQHAYSTFFWWKVQLPYFAQPHGFIHTMECDGFWFDNFPQLNNLQTDNGIVAFHTSQYFIENLFLHHSSLIKNSLNHQRKIIYSRQSKNPPCSLSRIEILSSELHRFLESTHSKSY